MTMKCKIKYIVDHGYKKDLHYVGVGEESVIEGFVTVHELHAWAVMKQGDTLNLTL